MNCPVLSDPFEKREMGSILSFLCPRVSASTQGFSDGGRSESSRVVYALCRNVCPKQYFVRVLVSGRTRFPGHFVVNFAHKFNAAGAYKACRSLLERTRVRESVLATKRSRALFRQLVLQVKRDTGGT